MNLAAEAFTKWLIDEGIPCTGYASITGNGSTPWPPSAITLTFDAEATQDQINYAYDSVNSFDYTPEAVAEPDPRRFQGLIILSEELTDLAKAQLMQYFGSIGQNADNLPGLQAGWQILIAAYTNTWLTPEVKAVVEAYAAAANMPLA